MTALFIWSGKGFLKITAMKWQTWAVALQGSGHGKHRVLRQRAGPESESAVLGSALYTSRPPEKLPPFLAHTSGEKKVRGSFTSLQLTQFHSFLWLSLKNWYINTVCVCVCVCVCVYIYMESRKMVLMNLFAGQE